jgi:hypothetical protein
MSVLAPFKNVKQHKVLNSDYIKTENEPDEDAKPSEQPASPPQPEEK